jgi:hypothetical protein
MKWILNLFWLLVVGYMGYSFGLNSDRKTVSNSVAPAIDVDIGSYLSRAACNTIDLQSMMEMTEREPIFGGQLATVTVIARRHYTVKLFLEQNKVTTNADNMIDELETRDRSIMFLGPTTLDSHVQTFWINKTV